MNLEPCGEELEACGVGLDEQAQLRGSCAHPLGDSRTGYEQVTSDTRSCSFLGKERVNPKAGSHSQSSSCYLVSPAPMTSLGIVIKRIAQGETKQMRTFTLMLIHFCSWT